MLQSKLRLQIKKIDIKNQRVWRSLAIQKPLLERLHMLSIFQRSEISCMPAKSQEFEMSCSVWRRFANGPCSDGFGSVLSHPQAGLLCHHCSSGAAGQLWGSPVVMCGLCRHPCSTSVCTNSLCSPVLHSIHQRLCFQGNLTSAAILSLAALSHAKSNT